MTGIRAYVIVAIAACFGSGNGAQYLGKFLGKLSELHHGVSGEVYAVDGRTLHIKDFTYDGQGPAAYFYASTYKTADSRGFRLRDENNNGEVIRRYRKEGVTITLPEGKTLSSIKIFYVWCEEFDVNFGDVKISQGFDFPRPQKIDALKGVHSISSDNIVIVDAQTLLIPNLYYDGEAPDAKFWVGRGPKPSPQGIRVPDENGKEVPLRRYNGKTVVLTLPGDLTVFDIGHFGIWCEQFTVDFGHIQIPQTLNVPPSLKMLGVSPQTPRYPIPDNSREVSVHRPRVGGHLQATTYRPPNFFAIAQRRQGDFNLAPQQNAIQPQPYVPFQQLPQNHYQQTQARSFEYQPNHQYVQQPTQYNFAQQQQQYQPLLRTHPTEQQYIQQPIQNHQVYQQQQLQPIAYQPLGQRYNEHSAYNSQLEEQQRIASQLARPRNRFDLSGAHQQSYGTFG
ncbi:protein Skeletor, isoforms B/C isoform X2 [Cylas formicarius]|uniref:protein Skeletor, isoforms B/C isoform X2 n=1 Tax=Cylas formicarius TaxID=197179 RepID=UPI002958C766|nr:protein Skeletor, isoforms B/C isoform X2 [Cylas formicarius]